MSNTIMTEEQQLRATMQALTRLIGKWHGRGRGEFPTIAPFQYEEELAVHGNGVDHHLHFEQRTWKLDHAGKIGEPLHWESGFIRALPNGVEIANAQNGYRVEVLRGELDQEALRKGILQMTLTSTLLGNDERMLQTRREFHVQGDRLKYKVAMATTTAPALHHHLEAALERVAWFEQLR